MAFKSVAQIEKDTYGKFLRLTDDQQSVKGVLLYKSYDDVLSCDVHYVKSKDYSGYVHCCGSSCPACQKGINIRQKLFIPILVLADLNEGYDEDCVVFWDRNLSFNHYLKRDVFDKYDNPSDFVVKITRNGEYRDRSTTYSISACARFSDDIDTVMKSLGVEFPDYYENVVRTVDAATLQDMLSDTSSMDKKSAYIPQQNYSYRATPRKRTPSPEDLDAVENVPGVPVESSEADSVESFDDNEETLESYSMSTTDSSNVSAPSKLADTEESVEEFEDDDEDVVPF